MANKYSQMKLFEGDEEKKLGFKYFSNCSPRTVQLSRMKNVVKLKKTKETTTTTKKTNKNLIN